MENMEVYVQSPTSFMVNNWHRLLPDWDGIAQTMVVVLLTSPVLLEGKVELMELEKGRLLQQFLAWGESFKTIGNKQGFITETISPKDGMPIYSKKGEINFDLVAIVHEALGLPFFNAEQGCKMLIHPLWHSAVYPGICLSDAPINFCAQYCSIATNK